jgi:hypothetical protein
MIVGRLLWPGARTPECRKRLRESGKAPADQEVSNAREIGHLFPKTDNGTVLAAISNSTFPWSRLSDSNRRPDHYK